MKIDAAKLQDIRARAARFKVGSAVQQIADLRFLLETIDTLMKEFNTMDALVKEMEMVRRK